MNFQFNNFESFLETVSKLNNSVKAIMKSGHITLYGVDIGLEPVAVSLIEMLEKVTGLNARIRKNTGGAHPAMVLKIDMHIFLRDVNSLLIYLIDMK